MYEVLLDPTKEVQSMLPMGEYMLMINYCDRDEYAEPLAYANPVIAAYVTAQARLRLYEFLERLQTRVLYCDTGERLSFNIPTL